MLLQLQLVIILSSDAVLCCIINSNGTVCYSGGLDFKIQCWNLPSLNIDLFGPYGKLFFIFV